MVTIKQLADEIGVSKTAVSKKIDKLGLRKQLSMRDNQWFIPDNVATMLKEAFKANYKSQTVSENQSQTVDTLISTLQEQIKQKDEQINAQNKQIEALLVAIDQAQKLQGIAEQKLKAIEDKQINSTPQRRWWPFGKKNTATTDEIYDENKETT